MKTTVLLIALLLSTRPAWAWETTPTPTNPTPPNVINTASSNATGGASKAKAKSSSNSSARSASNTTINNESGGNGGNQGRGPDVLAPSMATANNCAVGLTLGGGGNNGGGVLGLLWENSRCARNRDARLFGELGRTNVAIQLLCEGEENRKAMRLNGTPCQEDIQKYGAVWKAQGWRPTN